MYLESMDTDDSVSVLSTGAARKSSVTHIQILNFQDDKLPGGKDSFCVHSNRHRTDVLCFVESGS